MRADISVTIRSPDPVLNRIRPNAVSFSYGINMIPVVQLGLTPDDLFLLCDLESYRRKQISIYVNTVTGCLSFDGLVDGLSFSQGVGNAGAQLVVKSPFQILMETFPRLPGFHPGSASVFRQVETLTFNFTTPKNLTTNPDGTANLDFSNFLAKFAIESAAEVNVNVNVIKFIIETCKAFCIMQQKLPVVSSVSQDVSGLIQLAQKMGNVRLQQSVALLERIDTTATDGIQISGGSSFTLDSFLMNLTSNVGSLFDFLVSQLEMFGVGLVIGNKKAYTVPMVGFLKQEHETNIPFGSGTLSKNVNVAYPAQYDNVNLNDNGFRDIRAVYVISDEKTGNKTPDLGYYIDESISVGGVLTVSLPQYVTFALDGPYTGLVSKIHEQVKNQEPNINRLLKSGEYLDWHNKVVDGVYNANVEARKQFMNYWAEMRYLQAKYMDRVGSFSCFFNPVWAPGAMGVLYTRQPGVHIDFFVSAVNYNFSVSAPANGTATTSVSFNCGRLGKNGQSTGLDKITLYSFDGNSSKAFAKSFVSDITAV